MSFKKKTAFTLIEILVVIFIIGLLMGLMMPALTTARSRARSIICSFNIKQLAMANIGYANENNGFFVPAASDLWKGAGGYHRWHGVRDNQDEPFDPLRGPLVGYLSEGKVKECPARVNFAKGGSWSENFEQGCGGYGYNMTYIGGRLWQSALSFKERYSCTAQITEISKPSETLMFADCAMSIEGGSYIEYSFAEPPFFIIKGKIFPDMYASPSIHFRHDKRANVGWADGHTDSHRIAIPAGTNVYGVNSAAMNLGWFEPIDNTLFDLN